MTRSELINRMIEKHPDMSPQNVTQVVNELFSVMIDSLASGHRIELRGFGVFSLRLRQSNVGRNPINGESVDVPTKYVCHFKTGTSLHKNLNPQLQ